MPDAPRAPQPTPARGAGRRRGSAGGAPAAACGLSSSAIDAGAAVRRRRLGGGGADSAPPDEKKWDPCPRRAAQRHAGAAWHGGVYNNPSKFCLPKASNKM
eukprot:gene14733-biopygen6603